MQKMIFIAAFLLLFSISSFGQTIDVTGEVRASFKIQENRKDLRTVDVSFLVEVKNSGPGGKVYVQIQGLDFSGFEILLHNFLEMMGPNETKYFTSRRYFNYSDYDKVRTWKITKINKY